MSTEEKDELRRLVKMWRDDAADLHAKFVAQSPDIAEAVRIIHESHADQVEVILKNS